MRQRVKISRTPRKQLQLWPKPAPAEPSKESGPPIPWRGRAVHLIGIGGVGMSGIAALLPHYHCEVSGCDAGRSDITDSLVRRGIPVSIDGLSAGVRLVPSGAISPICLSTDPCEYRSCF